ncbi:zinc-binding alcohol dehydrogenase family protein [Nonomuraea typhae]|uniref:zinc-binding alcohol dehydrogenase family protein n=1 Tax=Nonomuraea typhae TaxID=2603600 RepID=UPI0031B5963C
MRAMEFARFGGPEVLEEVELPDPEPGPGELLIDVEAAGVNFADVRQVAGVYAPPGSLPHVPGSEVIGRTADGRRVMGFAPRGYVSKALLPEKAAIPVPETLGAGQALALLVQD